MVEAASIVRAGQLWVTDAWWPQTTALIEHGSAVGCKRLAIGGARRIFLAVSITLDRDNAPVPPREQRGRAGARHAAMLRAALDEISHAKPERLREIATNAELFIRLARGRGDLALERHAEAIRERAEKRLRR